MKPLKTASFLFASISLIAPLTAATQGLPSDQEIGEKITAASMKAQASLQQYSVVRTYKLHNSRLAGDAAMTVRLDYRKGEGDTFEVLANEHGSGMSRKVLNRILQSEKEASKKDGELDITKANYTFHVTGTATQSGRQCYAVDLIPNRKSRYLLQGKAWVDMTEFAIVRVEGHPAANLALGVGKPYIVLDFQKVGPFWMAQHNRSEAQSFLFGSSVLTIEFAGYEFPGEKSAAVTRPGNRRGIE